MGAEGKDVGIWVDEEVQNISVLLNQRFSRLGKPTGHRLEIGKC